MFSLRNKKNYLKILFITPSYLVLCIALVFFTGKAVGLQYFKIWLYPRPALCTVQLAVRVGICTRSLLPVGHSTKFGKKSTDFRQDLFFFWVSVLTLKVPVTTAADDIHEYFFFVFQRK